MWRELRASKLIINASAEYEIGRTRWPMDLPGQARACAQFPHYNSRFRSLPLTDLEARRRSLITNNLFSARICALLESCAVVAAAAAAAAH